MTNNTVLKTEFEEYVSNYDEILNRGLFLTGDRKSYFAKKRIAWLVNCLKQLNEKPINVMDFGCGIGSATGLLMELINAKTAIGIDSSEKGVEYAIEANTSQQIFYKLVKEYQPKEEIDLVYCNGVFHHIPIEKRREVVDYIYRSLRHGGLFAFWENNPWNPGTKLVMSRIPFDRQATTLTSKEAYHLLKSCSFKILRTDFLFIFPRLFRFFRIFEPKVSKLPFGAQYQILCTKV